MQIKKMAFYFIPDLHPQNKFSEIRVSVVRKWEYRGQTDDGPIQHIDLVLADEKVQNLNNSK